MICLIWHWLTSNRMSFLLAWFPSAWHLSAPTPAGPWQRGTGPLLSLPLGSHLCLQEWQLLSDHLVDWWLCICLRLCNEGRCKLDNLQMPSVCSITISSWKLTFFHCPWEFVFWISSSTSNTVSFPSQVEFCNAGPSQAVSYFRATPAVCWGAPHVCLLPAGLCLWAALVCPHYCYPLVFLELSFGKCLSGCNRNKNDAELPNVPMMLKN